MAEFKYIGLPAMLERGMNAVETATNQSAEHLVGASMAAETAVETGTLKASIHTDGAQRSGYGVTAHVMTGGEASAYAIYIHEGHRADGSHVIAAYPGGLKYIERPLLENRPVYLEAMAAAGRAAF